MMVIALGVKMAKLRGEIDLVRKEPKDLSEFRPEQLKEAYDAYSDTESSSSDEEQEEEKDTANGGEDDGWENVDQTRQEKRTGERLNKKKEWYDKK